MGYITGHVWIVQSQLALVAIAYCLLEEGLKGMRPA
jgi:hypothetical protein